MKRVPLFAIVATSLVLTGMASAGTPMPVAKPATIDVAIQQIQANAFDPATAASAAEDMIDFALAGDSGRVEEKLAGLRTQLPALKQSLGDTVAVAISDRMATIETALGRGDLNGTALAATDVFRIIVEAHGQAGSVPLEVSLLDYSGFKLKTLAMAESVDWAAVAAASDEAAAFWTPLSDKVSDKGLRDLMNSLHDGLRQGVNEKDASQVAFAAQMLLDAVDLLEKAFM